MKVVPACLLGLLFTTGTAGTSSNDDDSFRSFVLRIEDYEEVIHEQKIIIQNLTDFIEGQTQYTNSGNNIEDVAFTAKLGNDRAFAFDSVITFNEVVTNIGDGFVSNSSDQNYGKFIAPANGTYQFIVTVSPVSPGQTAAADLVVNSDFKVNTRSSVHGSGVCTAVVLLSIGDKVWARNPFWGSDTAEFKEDRTIFSGFLIHKT